MKAVIVRLMIVAQLMKMMIFDYFVNYKFKLKMTNETYEQ